MGLLFPCVTRRKYVPVGSAPTPLPYRQVPCSLAVLCESEESVARSYRSKISKEQAHSFEYLLILRLSFFSLQNVGWAADGVTPLAQSRASAERVKKTKPKDWASLESEGTAERRGPCQWGNTVSGQSPNPKLPIDSKPKP